MWKYCLLSRPYDFGDKAWLTRRALGLTTEFWREMTLQEQIQIVKMRLWEADNLNRLVSAMLEISLEAVPSALPSFWGRLQLKHARRSKHSIHLVPMGFDR